MTDPVRPTPKPPVRRSRTAGRLKIVIGVFLLVLMGTISWRMAPMLLAAPESLPDGSFFNASQRVARLVLGLFGSILLFGGLTVGIGTRQVVTGRMPARAKYWIWAAAGLIVVMALVTLLALKQGRA